MKMKMTIKEWTMLSHFGDNDDDEDDDENKGVDYVTTFWPVRSSCQLAVSS